MERARARGRRRHRRSLLLRGRRRHRACSSPIGARGRPVARRPRSSLATRSSRACDSSSATSTSSPEQLVFVPMLLLAPLPLVPLLVARRGAARAACPTSCSGSCAPRAAGSRARATPGSPSAPVLVLALLRARATPSSRLRRHLRRSRSSRSSRGDFAWTLLRDRSSDSTCRAQIARQLPRDRARRRHPLAARVRRSRSRASTSPFVPARAGAAGLAARRLLARPPERYAAALELSRAYRGTVMLLSDVVEFEDTYTAEHSRSVVDLVHAVADGDGHRPATSARSSSSPPCCTTSARSRSPRRS